MNEMRHELLPAHECASPDSCIESCFQANWTLQVTLASNSGVGPFARLRAGASIDSGAYIGNFCELKSAHVGQGSNVCHLSYLGDADVGDRANIGAGTITCNYSELHCIVCAHQTSDNIMDFLACALVM